MDARILADSRPAFNKGFPPFFCPRRFLTLGYSTLLGGSGNDTAYDVMWSGSRYYITGEVSSSDFPVTYGFSDTTVSALMLHAFVAKFNYANSRRLEPGVVHDHRRHQLRQGQGHRRAQRRGVHRRHDRLQRFSDGQRRLLHSYRDGDDAFVVRLNAAGNGMVASVCVGSDPGEFVDYDDSGFGIDVERANCVWICGQAQYGPNFYAGFTQMFGTMTSPVTTGDGFIAQVDMASPSLGAIAVFGGPGLDTPMALAQDGYGIYVTGTTILGDFPTSAGAFQSGQQGHLDTFVAKFNYGGYNEYSTMLGTSSDEYAGDVAVGSGGAYVTGYSRGSWPVTANAYDSVRNSDSNQYFAYLTRVHDDGKTLDYSTLIEPIYSSEGSTRGLGVCTGGLGHSDAWVTGDATGDLTLGRTLNYYQGEMDGPSDTDAFVARFDTAQSGTPHVSSSRTSAARAMSLDGPSPPTWGRRWSPATPPAATSPSPPRPTTPRTMAAWTRSSPR